MTKRRHKYSELSFFPFGNLPSLLSHVISFATGRAYTKFQEECIGIGQFALHNIQLACESGFKFTIIL